MHLEYKKDDIHLFVFTTTVLLSFSYCVYFERLNKYLIFLLLFYLSKIEI